MKKLVLLTAIGMAAGGSAMAQGTVDFHNANTYALTVSDGQGGPTNKLGAAGSLLGVSSTRVGLYVGANNASSWSQLKLVGLTTNSPSSSALFAGTFNGGNPFTVDPGLYAGSALGASISFGFIAWSDMSTMDALTKEPTTGYMGQSLIGINYSMGGGSTLPPATFGAGGPAVGQVRAFTLMPVNIIPEPTSLALAGLGLAGLLIFRRRN